MDLSNDCGSYPTASSPSLDNKRANKPLVERKRRGRINKSIDELKEIVLQALNKDDKDYCKMEKADILEMVVRHLKSIRRNQLSVESMGEAPPVWNNYRAGFNECASEVMQYMRTSHGVEHTVQMRMLGHLADCIQRVNSFTAVDPMSAEPRLSHPIQQPVASPPRHMASPHMTSSVTTPSHHMTSPPPHVVTTSRGGVPSATLETSLPGSAAPTMIIKPEPEMPHFSSTSGLGPVDLKTRRASPRVDQIVPGSHSPDLDLENVSMVDVGDLHIKRASPTATWGSPYGVKVIDRCLSPQLKVKAHMRSKSTVSSPYGYMPSGDRKSVNVMREIDSRNVWRPW